jgi:hypothetical protein
VWLAYLRRSTVKTLLLQAAQRFGPMEEHRRLARNRANITYGLRDIDKRACMIVLAALLFGASFVFVTMPIIISQCIRWFFGPPDIIPAPPGTVVLLTGEMRFETLAALEEFRHRLSGCTLCVCTWRRHRELAMQFAPPSRIALVDDEPSDAVLQVGGVAAFQFYHLQVATRRFESLIRNATAVIRMRTDAQYAPDFFIPSVPEGVVAMETDHAFVAAPRTFLGAYRNTLDEMRQRRYAHAREQGRSMLPNWENVVKSDVSNADKNGWRTRWRWLDYPAAIFPNGGRYEEPFGIDFAHGARHIISHARAHLGELMALRKRRRVPVRHLTTLPRVPHFCAESTFLHHTLEHAAVRPLEGVSITARDTRCPEARPCFAFT